MLGTTYTTKTGQVTTLLAPPVPAPPAPTAPSWVPWAIGAAIGGGVLFLLLRD